MYYANITSKCTLIAIYQAHFDGSMEYVYGVYMVESPLTVDRELEEIYKENDEHEFELEAERD